MLKRKIETILKNWKDAEGHKPLIIKGCRQCGKTFSVRQFAQENYTHKIYLVSPAADQKHCKNSTNRQNMV